MCIRDRVNELVQNALKYAFPSGQAGRIGIELHSGRPLCQLTVWDNGVGFQADRPRPGGAGLELASTICLLYTSCKEEMEAGNYNLCLKIQGLPSANPFSLFKGFMHTEGGTNISYGLGYHNDHVDELIEEAAACLDAGRLKMCIRDS